jgi:hypothetical protein
MIDASRLPPVAEIRHSSRQAAIVLAIVAAMNSLTASLARCIDMREAAWSLPPEKVV